MMGLAAARCDGCDAQRTVGGRVGR